MLLDQLIVGRKIYLKKKEAKQSTRARDHICIDVM